MNSSETEGTSVLEALTKMKKVLAKKQRKLQKYENQKRKREHRRIKLLEQRQSANLALPCEVNGQRHAKKKPRVSFNLEARVHTVGNVHCHSTPVPISSQELPCQSCPMDPQEEICVEPPSKVQRVTLDKRVCKNTLHNSIEAKSMASEQRIADSEKDACDCQVLLDDTTSNRLLPLTVVNKIFEYNVSDIENIPDTLMNSTRLEFPCTKLTVCHSNGNEQSSSEKKVKMTSEIPCNDNLTCGLNPAGDDLRIIYNSFSDNTAELCDENQSVEVSNMPLSGVDAAAHYSQHGSSDLHVKFIPTSRQKRRGRKISDIPVTSLRRSPRITEVKNSQQRGSFITGCGRLSPEAQIAFFFHPNLSRQDLTQEINFKLPKCEFHELIRTKCAEDKSSISKRTDESMSTRKKVRAMENAPTIYPHLEMASNTENTEAGCHQCSKNKNVTGTIEKRLVPNDATTNVELNIISSQPRAAKSPMLSGSTKHQSHVGATLDLLGVRLTSESQGFQVPNSMSRGTSGQGQQRVKVLSTLPPPEQDSTGHCAPLVADDTAHIVSGNDTYITASPSILEIVGNEAGDPEVFVSLERKDAPQESNVRDVKNSSLDLIDGSTPVLSPCMLALTPKTELADVGASGMPVDQENGELFIQCMESTSDNSMQACCTNSLRYIPPDSCEHEEYIELSCHATARQCHTPVGEYAVKVRSSIADLSGRSAKIGPRLQISQETNTIPYQPVVQGFEMNTDQANTGALSSNVNVGSHPSTATVQYGRKAARAEDGDTSAIFPAANGKEVDDCACTCWRLTECLKAEEKDQTVIGVCITQLDRSANGAAIVAVAYTQNSLTAWVGKVEKMQEFARWQSNEGEVIQECRLLPTCSTPVIIAHTDCEQGTVVKLLVCTEPGFFSEAAVLKNSAATQQDSHHSISCVMDSRDFVVAFCSDKTILLVYSFNSRDLSCEKRELTQVVGSLTTLCKIKQLDGGILGLLGKSVYLWNTTSGAMVKEFSMNQHNLSPPLLFAKEEMGFVFLLTSLADGRFGLLAVGDKLTTLLVTYDHEVTNIAGRTVACVLGHHLYAAWRSLLLVYNILSGQCLARVQLQDSITSIAVCKSTLLVGTENGCVHFYSAHYACKLQ
ncbi:PREDICTED: uncharacterized protein LOC106809539 [Priapulus caudatus]|uniref:Uncharacterized protein LOC106809539 n=1 Tax=Priapulus caudatus TaxID=37621 RepID=A0ABM1E7F1_PRICU|nr:PREDICTED: uncharacterized protein LOC106809539 [Priapulus caudatus]